MPVPLPLPLPDPPAVDVPPPEPDLPRVPVDAIGPQVDAACGPIPPGPKSWWMKNPAYRDGTGPYVDVSPVAVQRRLWALDALPHVRIVKIGESHQGHPLLAARVTDNPGVDEAEPAVLFTGATHGDELLSVLYAYDVLEAVVLDPAWHEPLDIWIIPQLNPDGVWTALNVDASLKNSRNGRKNGRDFRPPCEHDGDSEGVDLNRNFPLGWGGKGSSGRKTVGTYRGESAASEPETQALMALADRYHFAASISFHTNARAVLTPYTQRGFTSPEPDVPLEIARDLARSSPQRFSAQRRLYDIAGTDQDWLFHAHGTVAYIVEGSHHNPSDPAVVARSRAGVRPIWEGLLTRVRDGRRASGRVLDGEGHPLADVEVTVDGWLLHEQERWTTRFDGRFDRLLPADGPPVTLRAAQGQIERDEQPQPAH